jgi:two-component system NtrC family sensor kinase
MMNNRIKCSFLFLLLACFFGQDVFSQESDKERWLKEIAETDSDSLKYSLYSQIMGLYYPNLVDSSIYYLEKRNELAKQHGKRFEEGINYGAKGFLYMVSGKYGLSLENYLRAFEILENPETEKHYWTFTFEENPRYSRLKILTNFYFNFGHLMRLTENREKQKAYYLKVIALAEENNDPENISYANDGMAFFYLFEKKMDSVLYHIQKSLEIGENVENKVNLGYSKYIHGLILLTLGDLHPAMEEFQEGLAVSKSYGNFQSEVINLLGLSQGYQQTGNLDSALVYGYLALDGLEIIRKFDALDVDIATAYNNLFEVYQILDEPDSAFKYLLLAKTASDEINSEKITNLGQFQHLMLDEQSKIQELEKEQIIFRSSIRTYGLLAGLAVVVFIALIYYRNYRQKLKSNQILENTLAELKSTQAQLIQQEKLASLGQLTAGIAHEIQNPLNFVINFSEVSVELVEEIQDSRLKTQDIRPKTEEAEIEDEILGDIKQNLEKILHHGKRADAIVKGMLLHSRGNSGEKELTDINILVDEYLRLSYHGMRAKDKSFNAEFEAEFDPNLPKVEVVPQDIGRVLLNLINNAFQATNELSKGLEPLESFKPLVTVSTKNLGDKIQITISDNGPGIPDTIKEKIFQPFFTTKPTGQGTGLGLSLSYDIVKAHRGEIKVESELGNGTTFLIEIPVSLT